MLTLGSDFSKHFHEMQTAVTIGNFDGQHRGHRALFTSVIDYARQSGLKSVFFSFLPHPKIALSGSHDFKLITSYEERRFYLDETGVDCFIEYPFSHEFSMTEPKAFLDMIFKELNCKRLFVGEGYRFGKARAGKLSDFRDYADYCGVELFATPHVEKCGEKISSAAIREMILRKDFKAAAEALSRPYTIFCDDITTRIPEEKLLPPDGSYAADISVSGRVIRGRVIVDNKTKTAALDADVPIGFELGELPIIVSFI